MKQIDHDIPDGDKGIYTTVKDHMIRLVKRDTNSATVKNVAKGLKGDNDSETVYNTFKYVVDNYPYRNDPDDREQVSAPKVIIEKSASWGGQDCDDLSVLLACLLRANGFDAAFKVIDWKKGNVGYSHVYVLCRIPDVKKTIPLDPVAKMKGFGWEKAPVNRSKVFWI